MREFVYHDKQIAFFRALAISNSGGGDDIIPSFVPVRRRRHISVIFVCVHYSGVIR